MAFDEITHAEWEEIRRATKRQLSVPTGRAPSRPTPPSGPSPMP